MQGTRIVATPRMRPSLARKSTVQTAAAMELFQLADELSYISGVAAVTFAVTLVVSAPYHFMTLAAAAVRQRLMGAMCYMQRLKGHIWYMRRVWRQALCCCGWRRSQRRASSELGCSFAS